MDNWIATAVGKMHINKIEGKTLAAHLNMTPQYISEILNGKKNPKGAKEKILSAIDEIIKERRE